MPAELAAAVPAWSSRKAVLRIIRALAQQPWVVKLCRRAGVAVATWAAIITNDAIDADTATGRNMRTSQAVAAARVGRSEKQVQRARAVAVQVGIMVEVYRGRELSKAERLALVAEHPGHGQRGFANNYSVTVCGPRQRARISVPRPGRFARVLPRHEGFVHLPPEGGLSLFTHLLELLPSTAATAAEEAEPPAAARHRRKRRPGAALVRQVLAHPGLGVLLQEVRPGTLTGQLAPYAYGGWHGHALATAVLEQAHWAGIPTWEPAHSPWGLLKMLLSRVDPVADVHLGVERPAGVGELAGPPARPAPCGSPECDGHGWVNGIDEHGYAWARPCPRCSPQARAATWADEQGADTDLAGLGEPAF